MTEDKILKGTTTVGLVFNNGVVLAADKRASMENFIASKTVEKISILSDQMAMTMAGGVGDNQALQRYLKAEIELYKYKKGKLPSVKAISTLLANILQQSKFYPFFVQVMIGGFDSKPQLFDLDAAGGLMKENYTSTGSGSPMAYAILDDSYKEGMTEEDALKTAVKAVTAAMKRDSATGEGVDVVVIDSKKARKLTPQQIQNYLK
jgi:proteasome beta subunit